MFEYRETYLLKDELSSYLSKQTNVVKNKTVKNKRNNTYIEDIPLTLFFSKGIEPVSYFHSFVTLSDDDNRKLEEKLKKPRGNFAKEFYKIIDERGLDEERIFNKTPFQASTISKIKKARFDPESYNPHKTTLLTLAIAMDLSVDDAEKFLNTAECSFVESEKTSDVIVKFYMERGIYDIDTISCALIDHGQTALGYRKVSKKDC